MSLKIDALVADPAISSLKELQETLMSIEESNYTASMMKIKELGFFCNEKFERIIMFTCRADYVKSFKCEDTYLKVIDELSNDFDVYPYLNFLMFTNRRLVSPKLIKRYGKYEVSEFKEEEIVKIIREDDIDRLQEISSEPEFTFTKKVQTSSDDNPFFKFSLLNVCCIFGSINCFKFIMMNIDQEILNKKLKKCMRNAIFGGNSEIIHILEQNNVEVIENHIYRAIESNNSEIFDWILEKFPNSIEKDEVKKYIIECSFMHGLYQIKSDIDIAKSSKSLCIADFIELIMDNQDDMSMDDIACYCSRKIIEPYFEKKIKKIGFMFGLIEKVFHSMNIDFIDYLLKSDYEYSSRDFIELAIRNDNVRLVNYLLYNENFKNTFKLLLYAMQLNSQSTIELLMKHPKIDLKKEYKAISGVLDNIKHIEDYIWDIE